MYLDEAANRIRRGVGASSIPTGNSTLLLRLYALLLRSKGDAVTAADVHDAWAIWMGERDPAHVSLKPFEELTTEVQRQDHTFVSAIRSVARREPSSENEVEQTLFPLGFSPTSESSTQLLEQYKVMVQSSENLVSRRQAVNTFFLTINGALVTAFGAIIQAANQVFFGAVAVLVLSAAGFILCLAWRSLIRSFGQLNTGKFRVIEKLEAQLPAAIYAAEWVALGRGANPSIYRSFTHREVWVPIAIAIVHLVAFVASLLIALGYIALTQRYQWV